MIALVGLAGYGSYYLNALLDGGAGRGAVLAAAVDLDPQRCGRIADLNRLGVPTFASVRAMYDGGVRPDLVVLATPFQVHAEQACLALAGGSHVLCEKPIAPTLAEAAAMIAARDRARRTLSIGYQWAFAAGTRRLKADAAAGRFGRAVRFRTRVYWPRDEAYYTRNAWAGRLRSADGRPILDSPVNNACAHFVQNMLDLAGPGAVADWPAAVTAESYRAHPIENYDTAVIRCTTRSGVALLAAVSHATGRVVDPTFELAFERAVVTTGGADGHRIVARLADGQMVDYGPQPKGDDMDKLWATVAALDAGGAVACGAEAAAAHTALVDAAQRSAVPVPFPADLVRTAGPVGARSRVVPGLDEVLDRCYDQFALPSELGVSWARAGRPVVADSLPA